MSGVEVSPWTLRYVSVALGSFILAQFMLLCGLTYPALPVDAPTTLAAVHLVTLGWLSLLMLGVLHQFIPVIGAKRLHSVPMSGVTFWFVTLGILLMVLGFLSLPSGPIHGFLGADWLLPPGGTLVVLGVLVAVYNIGVTLWASRPLRLPAMYIAFSLGFLTLTVLLGLTFAISLTVPGAFTPHVVGVLGTSGLALHIFGGIGGWFALTAMGVADRLLAMFALAPEERGPMRHWALWLTSSGIALSWLVGFVLMFAQGAVLAGLGIAGWVLLFAGVVLYLLDMRQLYRRRRRRELEANSVFGRVSLWALGIAATLTAMAGAFSLLGALAAGLVYALLVGWLSGLALSQIYKIVPFLTWLERYGKALGKGKVPRVQDLVVERRARPEFWLYFAGAALGTIGMLASLAWLVQAAALVTLLATLGIAREIWLVRHPTTDPMPGGGKNV